MNLIVGKKDNGTPFMALSLEPGNLARLQGGQPIILRVEDSFPDGIPRKLELAIYFSETPIADARKLSTMADVVLDERTARQREKKPHCAECHSTIEQFGVMRNDSPVALVFCPTCGCVFGVLASGVVAGIPREVK